jgi:hypothetical protein
MPVSVDDLLADALLRARAFMEEGDYDDLSTKLEDISTAVIALDAALTGGARLPMRWRAAERRGG